MKTHTYAANERVKSCASFPSPRSPLTPTPPIKIPFCAPSLWLEYYSLLRDLESACLSPDWARAAEQLWKQWRSRGELWLVGEAGEIWDPQARFPCQRTACGIWASRGQAQRWRACLRAGGSPSLAWLELSGTLSSETILSFASLIPSMFSGLLHKHSVARQPWSLLSSWIPGNCPGKFTGVHLQLMLSMEPVLLSGPGFPSRSTPPLSVCLVHLIF